MQQKRILWLDQLKAIAFFFVILGHMSISGEPKNWIYSFHMPLFFLVSGFTFNLEKTAKSQFLPYCGKLFKRLALSVSVTPDVLCFGIVFGADSAVGRFAACERQSHRQFCFDACTLLVQLFDHRQTDGLADQCGAGRDAADFDRNAFAAAV